MLSWPSKYYWRCCLHVCILSTSSLYAETYLTCNFVDSSFFRPVIWVRDRSEYQNSCTLGKIDHKDHELVTGRIKTDKTRPDIWPCSHQNGFLNGKWSEAHFWSELVFGEGKRLFQYWNLMNSRIKNHSDAIIWHLWIINYAYWSVLVFFGLVIIFL